MERLPHELLLNILSFVGKEKVRRTIHAGGMQQQVPGFAIFDAGISVYTTPDWKVFDPSSSSKFGFLGMKCPHSKRGIKHHQIQTFKLKKLELIFFVIKDISITLKHKGSWPSLGFHGVIFVYICQTLMNSFLFWLLGKWATTQIQQHIFQLCTFIYCRASKKSPKLFKNQWRISTCRSHT